MAAPSVQLFNPASLPSSNAKPPSAEIAVTRMADYLNQLNGGRTFQVVEAAGGTGTYTAALLSNPKVEVVITMEANSSPLEQTLRNHPLGLASRTVLIRSAFEWQSSSSFPKGCTLFLNGTGGPIGGKRPEEWLEVYKGIAYCAVLLMSPADGLPQTSSWQYVEATTKAFNPAGPDYKVVFVRSAIPGTEKRDGETLPPRLSEEVKAATPMVLVPGAPLSPVLGATAPTSTPSLRTPPPVGTISIPATPGLIRTPPPTGGIQMPAGIRPPGIGTLQLAPPALRPPALGTLQLPPGVVAPVNGPSKATRVVATPTIGIPQPVGPLRATKPAAPVYEAPVKQKPALKEGEIDWELFCASLPTPTTSRESPERLRELQVFIDRLLSTIVPAVEIRNKLLTPEAMQIWVQGFTHQTYDVETNYETLETYGDVSTKYAFKKYLIKRFPQATPAILNEYLREYMSKKRQAEMATLMKLEKWILAETDISISIREDLLEAFFGALEKVSDAVKVGFGFINCFNYMPRMYRTVEFDPSIAFGPPKTTLVQYGQRLGWDRADKENDKTGGIYIEINQTSDQRSWYATVTLSQAGLDDLRRHRFTVSNPLGRGTASSYTAVQEVAYQNALDALNLAIAPNLSPEERGTAARNWILEEKLRRVFESLNQELVGQLQVKAKQQGFLQLAFDKPKSSTTAAGFVLMLRGSKDAIGKLPFVLSRVEGTDEQQAREDVIRAYLAQTK